MPLLRSALALLALSMLAMVLPGTANASRPATSAEEAGLRKLLAPATGCSFVDRFTVSTVAPSWALVTRTDTGFDCQSGMMLARRVRGGWASRWVGSDGSWADKLVSCAVVRDLAPDRSCDSKTYLTNGISSDDESLEVRPRSIAFGAAHALTNIRWANWGRATASGAGTCAWSGRDPVKITALRLTKLNGKRRYSKLVARYASGPHAGKIHARCSL